MAALRPQDSLVRVLQMAFGRTVMKRTAANIRWQLAGIIKVMLPRPIFTHRAERPSSLRL
jgi:hypothetical protein